MRRDGVDPETAPDTNRIALFPNGPLLVRGDVEVVDNDGEVLLRDTRMALCRCGLSANKPLCDGSHDGAFEDPGVLQAERLSGAADAEGPLRFKRRRTDRCLPRDLSPSKRSTRPRAPDTKAHSAAAAPPTQSRSATVATTTSASPPRKSVITRGA